MLAKDLKIREFGITESNLIVLRVNDKFFYSIKNNYLFQVSKNQTLAVQKLEDVKITYKGCPETKLEYPKEMYVSLTSDFKFKLKKLIIAEHNNIYYEKGNIHEHGNIWEFAKNIEPEEELIHLTLQDISEGKGVGVNPELMRIKK